MIASSRIRLFPLVQTVPFVIKTTQNLSSRSKKYNVFSHNRFQIIPGSVESNHHQPNINFHRVLTTLHESTSVGDDTTLSKNERSRNNLTTTIDIIDVKHNTDDVNKRKNKFLVNDDWKKEREKNVWILDQGKYHAIVYKPPSVICHHSEWSGSKAKAKRNEEPTPMLQRVRDALHYQNGENNDYKNDYKIDQNNDSAHVATSNMQKVKVNLVHRLDRGASGCLLFAFADSENENEDDSVYNHDTHHDTHKQQSATAALQQAMQHANKTYVALVRGSGVFKGRDLKQDGWFPVHRPIKDESGRMNNATTYFYFVAGVEADDGRTTQATNHENTNNTDNTTSPPPPRASLVLARPITGRWHQVRKHLNGLSHPILGDTSHGCSKTNREWRTYRQMPYQRTFLHLARLQLPYTPFITSSTVGHENLNVACPLPPDFMQLLQNHLPSVLHDAKPILQKEGIELPTVNMLNSSEDFGGTSANDNTDLPSLQKRYEDKLKKRDDTNKHSNNHDDRNDVHFISLGSNYAVAYKPPRVVCHYSSWTAGNSNDNDNDNDDDDEPTPMLQRVRDAITKHYFNHSTTTDHQYRVNLIHRLDRSASGCLLFSIPPPPTPPYNQNNQKQKQSIITNVDKNVTSSLIQALQSPHSTKTYIALVHGNGICRGQDLTKKGWFTISSTLKDENDEISAHQNATTQFRFLASSTSTSTSSNISTTLVLARPQTGQYHQIRLHLSNQLHHPIIGDSSHGYTRSNRIWRTNYGLLSQRTCLHLAHLQLPRTNHSEAINVYCPLSMANDMMTMIETFFPNLLSESKQILQQDGEQNDVLLF